MFSVVAEEVDTTIAEADMITTVVETIPVAVVVEATTITSTMAAIMIRVKCNFDSKTIESDHCIFN